MYESTPTAAVKAEGGQIWQTVGGRTRVIFLFRPQLGDFWGLVPKPIVRRIYMRPLSNNMKRLKQVLESQR